MKEKCIIAFMILVSSIKAQDTTHIINAPHGGILKNIQSYKIEAVESYGCVSIYVYDDALKPIPNKGISGEILFFYNNDAGINVALIPKLNNSFVAEVLNSDYYYYTVNLKVNNNTIKAKFNNLTGLADRKSEKIKPNK